MARVLVAPDSFKGTYSATDVARAIGAGLADGGAEADLCPVADGGEGTMEILLEALGGRAQPVLAHDPLGREIEAEIGIADDGMTGIVEMARASGLGLVEAGERDAEAASTYGTGELIAAAAQAGVTQIVVTIGGSATTDGGAGALEAIDRAGGIGDCRIVCLCDVDTPFERAAEVFGPQKGADSAAVARLTARLEERARALQRDPRGVPGTGAAGGLSGALWAAYGAELRPGAEWILDTLGFDARLTGADAVISGEGRLDDQTLAGKIVGAVAQRAVAAGVPLHAVVGSSSLNPQDTETLGLASVQLATDEDAMRAAGRAIAATCAKELA